MDKAPVLFENQLYGEKINEINFRLSIYNNQFAGR